MAAIRQELFTLPGSPLGPENPLPYPRDCAFHKPLVDAGLYKEEQAGFRFMTGARVLPCKMQDGYRREKTPMALNTIVLENQFLRARFLPEYGGRLYSLYDKERARELLFVNPVFQPCNLAVRNAWFSGGIEWNAGQYGHSSLTAAPVFFGVCGEGGEPFLRMYEYERIKGLYVQLDFHLPEGERHLFAHVRLINRKKEPASLYWWTNTAVELNRRARVLSGTGEVVITLPEGGKYNALTHDALPHVKSVPGVDVSYPENCPRSVEYFFQNPKRLDTAWEAVAYEDGTAFYERSTPEMPYRKMFAWGSHAGGRHWQHFLATAEAAAYVEVQSGLYPTQVHGGELGPGESVAFTQAFGGCGLDAAKTHGGPWDAAKEYLYETIEERLPADRLLALDRGFRFMAATEIDRLLHTGGGWGALEEVREPGVTPKGLRFPKETMGEEQEPWLALLEKREMPPFAGLTPPSYQCGWEWLKLLEGAVRSHATAPNLFHLGIARFEEGDAFGGASCLKQATALANEPIVWRTLGMMQRRMGLSGAAARSVGTAMTGEARNNRYFAEDYLEVLIEDGQFKEAWAFYNSLKGEAGISERAALLTAIAAYELGEDAFLEAQFARVFATIREGENRLGELFKKYGARRLMGQTGLSFPEALSRTQNTPLPPALDFRMCEDDGA